MINQRRNIIEDLQRIIENEMIVEEPDCGYDNISNDKVNAVIELLDKVKRTEIGKDDSIVDTYYQVERMEKDIYNGKMVDRWRVVGAAFLEDENDKWRESWSTLEKAQEVIELYENAGKDWKLRIVKMEKTVVEYDKE